MRLRKNPEAPPFLKSHPLVIKDYQKYRGHWKTYFSQTQSLHVELGTGKGQFLAHASQIFPDVHWVGVERSPEPLMKAVKKGEHLQNGNLHYLWIDVNQLDEIFIAGEVDRFYLHFSDPWPKKRHAKRRLTHRSFLQIYQRLLSDKGDLILKTDHQDLYEYSREELIESGRLILEQSTDLHHSPWQDQNILTEYEEKFAKKGVSINYIRCKKGTQM